MELRTVEDKPMLVKAMEVILANPLNIKNEAISLMGKFEKAHPSKSKEEVKRLVARKIISNYSGYAAMSGAVTALPGVIPGVGTAVAVVGGATTDTAMFMKFQVEMTMALATVYGHDILQEEEKRLCWIIAGVGALNEAAKKGATEIGSKAFNNMVQKYLKEGTLTAVKEIFKMIGIKFTKKGLEKVIPFGVGVLVGAGINKGTSVYIGNKALGYFSTEE